MIQKHIRYATALKKAKPQPKLLKPNWLDAQKRWNKVLLARIGKTTHQLEILHTLQKVRTDPALAQFKHSLLSK